MYGEACYGLPGKQICSSSSSSTGMTAGAPCSAAPVQSVFQPPSSTRGKLRSIDLLLQNMKK
jgi:hypothetical protein